VNVVVILDEGLNRIKVLVANDVNQGQIGLGTAAAYPTDTGLGSAIVNTTQSLGTAVGDLTLKLTYTNPSTGTVGTSSEFVNRSTTANADYDRIVYTEYIQPSNTDLIIIKRYFFRRN